MAQSAPPANSAPRLNLPLLILILVSILLVGGLILFLLFASQASPGGSNTPIPYGVNARPLPEMTAIRDLFPQTLGAFTRKTVNGDLSGATAVRFNASYASGKETIKINGVRESSTAQMLNDFTQPAAGIIGTDRTSTVERSFAFVMATAANGDVRLLYGRAFWLFDITASSRPALDEFMKVFKY